MFESEVAATSHEEYIQHLSELTTKIWTKARLAQRLAQEEAAHYYNRKRGIKRDIGVGDLVLRKALPRHATDIPSHLLPRCSGPYRVLRVSTRGALIKHATTGQEVKTSLRHLRRCLVRHGDERFDTSGSLKLTSDDYVIVSMQPEKESSKPKWQVAKLLYPTLDDDIWVIQWCNVPGTGPARRMDGRFKLAWFLEADSEQEVYGSNCPKGYLSATWAVKSRRFLTASFKLEKHGKLPATIKAHIKAKYESKYW